MSKFLFEYSTVCRSFLVLSVLISASESEPGLASYFPPLSDSWLVSDGDVLKSTNTYYHEANRRRQRKIDLNDNLRESNDWHDTDPWSYNNTRSYNGGQVVMLSLHDTKNESSQEGYHIGPGQESGYYESSKAKTSKDSQSKTSKIVPITPSNYPKIIRTLVFTIMAGFRLKAYKRFLVTLRAHYSGDILLFQRYEGLDQIPTDTSQSGQNSGMLNSQDDPMLQDYFNYRQQYFSKSQIHQYFTNQTSQPPNHINHLHYQSSPDSIDLPFNPNELPHSMPVSEVFEIKRLIQRLRVFTQPIISNQNNNEVMEQRYFILTRHQYFWRAGCLRGKYDYCLHAGGRDVWFQTDPFKGIVGRIMWEGMRESCGQNQQGDAISGQDLITGRKLPQAVDYYGGLKPVEVQSGSNSNTTTQTKTTSWDILNRLRLKDMTNSLSNEIRQLTKSNHNDNRHHGNPNSIRCIYKSKDSQEGQIAQTPFFVSTVANLRRLFRRKVADVLLFQYTNHYMCLECYRRNRKSNHKAYPLLQYIPILSNQNNNSNTTEFQSDSLSEFKSYLNQHSDMVSEKMVMDQFGVMQQKGLQPGKLIRQYTDMGKEWKDSSDTVTETYESESNPNASGNHICHSICSKYMRRAVQVPSWPSKTDPIFGSWTPTETGDFIQCNEHLELERRKRFFNQKYDSDHILNYAVGNSNGCGDITYGTPAGWHQIGRTMFQVKENMIRSGHVKWKSNLDVIALVIEQFAMITKCYEKIYGIQQFRYNLNEEAQGEDEFFRKFKIKREEFLEKVKQDSGYDDRIFQYQPDYTHYKFCMQHDTVVQQTAYSRRLFNWAVNIDNSDTNNAAAADKKSDSQFSEINMPQLNEDSFYDKPVPIHNGLDAKRVIRSQEKTYFHPTKLEDNPDSEVRCFTRDDEDKVLLQNEKQQPVLVLKNYQCLRDSESDSKISEQLHDHHQVLAVDLDFFQNSESGKKFCNDRTFWSPYYQPPIDPNISGVISYSHLLDWALPDKSIINVFCKAMSSTNFKDLLDLPRLRFRSICTDQNVFNVYMARYQRSTLRMHLMQIEDEDIYTNSDGDRKESEFDKKYEISSLVSDYERQREIERRRRGLTQLELLKESYTDDDSFRTLQQISSQSLPDGSKSLLYSKFPQYGKLLRTTQPKLYRLRGFEGTKEYQRFQIKTDLEIDSPPSSPSSRLFSYVPEPSFPRGYEKTAHFGADNQQYEFDENFKELLTNTHDTQSDSESDHSNDILPTMMLKDIDDTVALHSHLWRMGGAELNGDLWRRYCGKSDSDPGSDSDSSNISKIDSISTHPNCTGGIVLRKKMVMPAMIHHIPPKDVEEGLVWVMKERYYSILINGTDNNIWEDES